ncbi:MAG: tRNA-modifying protein YgfZ [Verrucomicrobiota bacterium]|jgi:folate-binding protein YgfZ
MGRLLAAPYERLNPFFDLSARVKLRLTGADTFRFLNGQMTNDLRKATVTSAIQASVLSAKGKLSAHVFISEDADGFLLDADPELRDDLSARLDRYIIADDVEIEDVTDRFAVFHIASEGPANALQPARAVAANRFASAGHDLWFEKESVERERIREQLAETFAFCDDECAEIFRIERGIPRWGRELTDEIIPVEANLETTSIDYFKGCYVGQEVISRMKMSGQTNKRLRGLISLSAEPLKAGMRLEPIEGEKKDVGWITSAARSSRLEKEIALGYVKRGFNTIGSHLRTDANVLVEIVPIPFV